MRVFFCGLVGYPTLSYASMNRYVAIAKAMTFASDIVFVNSLPSDDPWGVSGEFTTFNVFGGRGRSRRRLVRIATRAVAPFFEAWAFFREAKKDRIHWINVYTEHAAVALFYWCLARLIDARTVLHVVEKRSQITGRNALLKINDAVFERFMPRIYDRFVVISDYLAADVRARNPKAELVKIPPIVDFQQLAMIPTKAASRPYVMYCASAAYADVIEFVVDAVERAGVLDSVDLLLIVPPGLPAGLERRIAAEPRIIRKSGLPYEDLIGAYKGALALLAPLRPTIQDTARFPQKICEYVACRRPVVSTRVGEIASLFSDGESALLSPAYTVAEYAAKIKQAVGAGPEINQLAERAYELGRRHFDAGSYTVSLARLLTV